MFETSKDHQLNIIEIEAIGLSSDGSGVGRDGSGVITFMPGLLPGEIGLIEIVERKKKWQRGELKKIIKSSEYRINPHCSVFGVCGGCQLQHMRYEETLKWKKIWVEEALQRIGKLNLDEIKVHSTIGMDIPWRYRNKARLHVDCEGRIGYYQQKTNTSVVFSDCLIISERMKGWIKKAKENLKKHQPNIISDVFNLTWRENKNGAGLLIIERSDDNRWFKVFDPEGRFELNGDKLRASEACEAHSKSDEQKEMTFFIEDILGFKYHVSPLSFLQVNSAQTEILYKKALEYAALTGKETVFDLYCGIGTMTLHFASKAREVIGIEENPYAVSDAKLNAKINGIDNVRFIQGKTENQLAPLVKYGKKPDVIVLDPPRAGVDPKGLEQIIKASPKRIVYVSCDPGTLARDLGRLTEGGYTVLEVQPVDMFPWSAHVETVVMMSRAK